MWTMINKCLPNPSLATALLALTVVLGLTVHHCHAGQGLEPVPPDPMAIEPATLADPIPSPLIGGESLEVLVAEALAHNPQIRAARLKAQAARARVPQAASMPDPQLMTTFLAESIQTAAGPQQAIVRLSQTFPFFGKRSLRSHAAAQLALAAHAEASVVELSVVEQLKRTYWDLYFLDRSLNALEEIRPELEQVLAVARAGQRSGKIGMESVLQLQTELSKLDVREVQLMQTRRRAEERLRSILSRNDGQPIQPRTTLEPCNVLASAETLVALADAAQPELDARRREAHGRLAGVALAERNYWPDVTLSAQWHKIGEEGLSPVANGEDAFSLGVGMNLPIYRARLNAAAREARLLAAASSHKTVATRDRMRAEIATLHADVQTHQRMVEILRDRIVPDAEQALELALNAYRVGRIELTQWLAAYRAVLEHRVDLDRHESSLRQAIASLERAVGTVL